MKTNNGKIGGHDPDRAAHLFGRYDGVKLAAFRAWLERPHGRQVYGLFARFARQWLEAGHDRCGADMLANRIRWEMHVEHDGALYKVKNDFTPMMARQLVLEHPEFDGFFELRDGGKEAQ